MARMSLCPSGLRDVFVDAMLAAGHAWGGRSQYGDKPALFAGRREIAHLEPDGAVDLRITEPDGRRPGRTSPQTPRSCAIPADGTGSNCA